MTCCCLSAHKPVSMQRHACICLQIDKKHTAVALWPAIKLHPSSACLALQCTCVSCEFSCTLLCMRRCCALAPYALRHSACLVRHQPCLRNQPIGTSATLSPHQADSFLLKQEPCLVP